MPTQEQTHAKWRQIATLAEILAERSGTSNGFAVAQGSPLAGDDVHCQPYHASHAVRTSITAAVDHLHALCALVVESGYLHLAAPATLARGVLECASTAIWIASPTTRDERVERALRWNIADVKDGDRAATGAGLAVPTPLQDRKDKIEAVANRRALSFKRISGGYTSSEAVAAAEDFLKPPLGVVLPWRLASGFAHGRRWAMLAFSDTMQKQASAEPGVVNVKMENDHTKVLFLGLAGAQVLKGAVRLFEQRGTAP
ncbi:hypothetical protein [Amycolatopsis sp. NPDC004625]|uniref:hypothetical protein n=1 Tax=Amycolatopsis sp. NPDC004625 TaxID=3154670 RepID=UPI0033B306F3